MKAKQILVSGKVQGVGYRYFVLNCAVELGVYGTVKNLPSGEVEVIAVARPEIFDQFIKKLRQGPERSKVDNLLIQEFDSEKVDFSDFVVLI